MNVDAYYVCQTGSQVHLFLFILQRLCLSRFGFMWNAAFWLIGEAFSAHGLSLLSMLA